MSDSRRVPVRLIRDPVYGYIEVPPAIRPIVDHPLFQRLRRVGQTSMTSSVYPSSTGTRFEHSLGAMHLARLVTRSIADRSAADPLDPFGVLLGCLSKDHSNLRGPSRELVVDAVGAVGLLHDVGHPPFSHVLEPAFSRLWTKWEADTSPAHSHPSPGDFGAFHERAGLLVANWIFSDLEESETSGTADSEFVALVAAILRADPDRNGWDGTLHGIVAGELDVDRLDYVMRDAQRAGTEFGSIDYLRLVKNAELSVVPGSGDHFALGFGSHARSAAETLIIQRAQSYRWITFHHKVRASNCALAEAFDLLLDLGSIGREVLYAGESIAVAQLFRLDDRVLNYVSGEATAPLPIAQRSAPLTVAAAARVDDGLVVQILFDYLQLAQEVVELNRASTHEDHLVKLRTFCAMAATVLMRQSHMHPIWKTGEHLAQIVRGHHTSSPKLQAAIADARQIAERTALKGEVGQSLANYMGETLTRIEESGNDLQLAMASVLRVVARSSSSRARLIALLKDKAASLYPDMSPKQWLVDDVSWASLRRQGRTGVMFFEGASVELAASSPLLGALDVADDGRLSTMLYMVTLDEREARVAAAQGLSRTIASQTFGGSLPAIVADLWPRALQARLPA